MFQIFHIQGLHVQFALFILLVQVFIGVHLVGLPNRLLPHSRKPSVWYFQLKFSHVLVQSQPADLMRPHEVGE